MNKKPITNEDLHATLVALLAYLMARDSGVAIDGNDIKNITKKALEFMDEVKEYSSNPHST